jgi:hypothetical protein
MTCSAGACVATCNNTQKLCGTTCIDVQVDPNNCGDCAHACDMGTVCVSGVCSGTCSPGYATCMADGGSPYCSDVTQDSHNCGICGHACGQAQVCVSSQCTSQCTTGRTPCGTPATCIDTMTDLANCGGCGMPCAQGLVCSGGTCDVACSAPLTSCASGGMPAHFCANTQNDPRNCGACGNVCPAQSYCAAGTCRSVLASTCAELQQMLGGAGVDGPATLYINHKPWFPFRATCADMDGGATNVTVTVVVQVDDAGNKVVGGNGQYVFVNDSGVVTAGTETGPKTYLDLPNQAMNQNFSQYNNVGFPGTFPPFLTDRWSKVRFDTDNLQVKIDDFRFVTTAGLGGNMAPTGLTYGTGGACNGLARGAANIDVRNTPFLIDPANGWNTDFSCCTGVGGTATFSNANQTVDVLGGGSCGQYDLYSNPLGGNHLQLRQRPFTCNTIKLANAAATDGVYSLYDGTPLDGGSKPPAVMSQ